VGLGNEVEEGRRKRNKKRKERRTEADGCEAGGGRGRDCASINQNAGLPQSQEFGLNSSGLGGGGRFLVNAQIRDGGARGRPGGPESLPPEKFGVTKKT